MAKTKIKTIAILTGGGDCPGLNAVIRAVSKTAIYNYDIDVLGVEDGYLGLIENRLRPLRQLDVSGILTIGGTILGTSNIADPFHFPVKTNGKTIMTDVSHKVISNLKKHNVDALICIGGDGTMASAAKLAKLGIPIMGVPKTIDNDLVGTDMTFGFDTAVTTATEAIDKVHTTASSHHRVMIIEVMGRYAGWIALHAGVASGSDIILIPEIPFKISAITDFILDRSARGKRFSIITVAEGAKEKGGALTVQQTIKDSPDPIRLGGIAARLSAVIQQKTNLETRPVVLGHIQRGGTPTPFDRVLATNYGYTAIKLLMEHNIKNHLVVMQGGKFGSIPLSRVAGKIKPVPKDHPLVQAAKAVATCFGV